MEYFFRSTTEYLQITNRLDSTKKVGFKNFEFLTPGVRIAPNIDCFESELRHPSKPCKVCKVWIFSKTKQGYVKPGKDYLVKPFIESANKEISYFFKFSSGGQAGFSPLYNISSSTDIVPDEIDFDSDKVSCIS